ncbi:hypothetical protein CsSME_00008661 [Camellia sinensis var. sinensis]
MCIERTAECQDTMMGGTGHCGSCQCLVAVILHKSSMKSMIARRLTQMRIFVAWPSTASTNVNVCPLSFKNPPPPPKAVAASRSSPFSIYISLSLSFSLSLSLMCCDRFKTICCVFSFICFLFFLF